MTAPEPEHCTSKFPKKLAKDIFLSMDIGRSSPMDPFGNGDLTKLFSDKKSASGGLMYFASKPLRKTKGAVLFSKMPHSHDSTTHGMYPQICQTSYDVELQPTTKDVSFTTAKRFQDSKPISQQHLKHYNRKAAQTPNGTTTRRSGSAVSNAGRSSAGASHHSHGGVEGRKSAAFVPQFSMSRTVRSTHEPKDIVQKIDDRKAPTLGGKSGPTIPPPFKPKSQRLTNFPWEKQGFNHAAHAKKLAQEKNSNKNGGEVQKEETVGGEGGSKSDVNVAGDASASSPSPQKKSQSSVNSTSNVNNASSVKKSTNTTAGHSSMGHHSKRGGANATSSNATGGQGDDTANLNSIETEEDWNREHKSIIARYGLVAGVGRKERLKKKAKPKGADFSTSTGRDAPTSWIPPGKELNENTYQPKYEVTSKERKKNANVRLDRYSSRDASMAPHLVTANKVMSLDHILKFHQKQLKRERESALALPDAENNDTGKPMTAADDFTSLPSSLYPPSTSTTRKFRGAPDLTLYADRPDEPISAILGGDSKKYYRAARKEMEQEEEELKKREEEEFNEQFSMLDF